MKMLCALSFAALLLAPSQQEDWGDELKKMDEELNRIQGPLYLLRSLRQEMLRATKALDESRLDLADRHFLRLAHMSRPYNENHANRVVAIAFALRGEIRGEGVALALAVAEDLKQGRVKEAQARIDEAVATPHLATTYRAEFERLRAWLAKPPDPAAVEAELARWRALAPPGSVTACGPCKGSGESDCAMCQGGTLPQSCRNCAGKGEGPCALCLGKGKLVHGGFAGDLHLRVDKDFKAMVTDDNGKVLGRGTFWAQRIIWTLKPCGGKNAVHLHGRSTPVDPAKEKKDEKLVKTCNWVYTNLQLYVFSGKALLFSGADAKKDKLTVEEVKRMFAEYEKCKDGFIPCSACEGRLTGKCGPCGGKGMRLGACSVCGGSGSSFCTTCRASGDSSWLAAKIPVERVPALGGCLDTHVKALQEWQDKRAKARARREQVRARLAEAKKGLDPTAKLTPEYVNVMCGKCAGKGEKCEECWGAGRREYFPGTPVFDKYALVKKLEEQFAQLSKASFGVSTVDIQLHIADNAVDKDFKMPPPAKPPEPIGPQTPPPTPEPKGTGRIADLPADLQEAIAKADVCHEEGKKAYDLAVAAGDDNEKRKAEAVKAKDCFKQAAELYGKTLETLDEQGIITPKELNEKYSLTLQALKLARNLAF